MQQILEKAPEGAIAVSGDGPTELSVVDPVKLATEALDRLHKVRKTLNDLLPEREQEVEGVLLAVVSETSAFFYGDPGTAKSMLIDTACTLLGLKNFDILLSDTTKPDQIFGPIDVPALAAGRQVFKIDGYAPTAEVLFFDEIFKANAAVLNPLLQLINEHKFRNGDDGMIPCPVRTVFAASNEIPTDTALRAIYDRLLLRYYVRYLALDKSIHRASRAYLERGSAPMQAVMTPQDVEVLRQQARDVDIPEALLQKALDIRRQVEQAIAHTVSDRRFMRSLRLIQASALLNERKQATDADLAVLANLYWQAPEQVELVQNIVWASTSTGAALLSTYSEEAAELERQLTEGGALRARLRQLKALYKTVKKYSGPLANKIADYVRQVGSRYENLIERRKVINLLKVKVQGQYIYKLSDECAPCWTTAELRELGFRHRRKHDYRYVENLSKISTVAKLFGATIHVTK